MRLPPPMREQIESDLAGGDQTQDRYREMPIDRLQSLAYASTLGIALKRLATQRNARHLINTIEALRDALWRANVHARKHSAADLLAIAKLAVLEWLNPICGRCEGRGWVPAPARVDCPKCNGTGHHPYSSGERARAFGRKMGPVEVGRLEEAHGLIRDHDDLTGRVARHMVER